MVDLVARNGIIITMNGRREVLEDGAVAVDDGEIIAVGPTETVTANYDGDRIVDATDCTILPGLVDVHVHVADILARGLGHDRSLHDWLFNVKRPIVGAMDAEDHAFASALYTREALLSGITTFVENAGGTGAGYPDNIIEAKLAVYEDAGLRNVYAHGFLDGEVDPEFAAYLDLQRSKVPSAVHPEPRYPTVDGALDRVASLIEAYHKTAEGRQHIWPAPYLAGGCTIAALRGAYELAEEHDVMTTTHTAETRVQERHLASSIERLHAAGYLGERTLLAHCVHVDDRDRRLLATSDTKVAHNVVANLSLGSGVAPIPAMLDKGITVGLGTDNPCQNDLVNLLSDARITALTHQGQHEDPGILTAERVLEMATIDGARAIGRGNDLGSLEPGKRADFVVIDMDHPNLVPSPNIASALVYQTTGSEVQTVVCDGEIIMENRQTPALAERYGDLHDEARRRATDVVTRAGLEDLRESDNRWRSVSAN